MNNSSCIYQVDAQDRVDLVEGGWTKFARENGGERLLNDAPIGRPIWDFILGMSTRNIYHVLMKQVRKTGRTIRIPFRCDSPDMLRYMEMEISPGEDNAVQFRTSLISQLERDSTTPIPTRETIVQMCAWCDLVLVGGEWLSLEDAIWMMGLLDAQEAPPISHGMCANCIDALKIEARPKHHLAD